MFDSILNVGYFKYKYILDFLNWSVIFKGFQNFSLWLKFIDFGINIYLGCYHNSRYHIYKIMK